MIAIADFVFALLISSIFLLVFLFKSFVASGGSCWHTFVKRKLILLSQMYLCCPKNAYDVIYYNS